jgi:hypothetical protein
VPNIDEYSVASIPIEMMFNSTFLSIGTAFVWSDQAQFYLITNWHNASGKNPQTRKHLSATAAEPNQLKVWFNAKGQLGNKLAKFIPLRGTDGQPLWKVHALHREAIDVVAIPIEAYADVEMYAVNTLNQLDLMIRVGNDVFVLGYPFGLGPGGLPIWKRASVASEPELISSQQSFFLLDTASRPGMSGSPIIRRTWNTHQTSDGNVLMGVPIGSKFVGVYSGRLVTSDPLDAQLGLAWPAQHVQEIVHTGVFDT